MRFLPATILLTSFIGIAVFGVFGMYHGQAHAMDQNNCIAATAKGMDCPKEAGAVDFTAFHIDAYKGLSLATFGENVMKAFLLVSASLLFIGLAFFSPHLFKPPQLAFYRYQFRDSFSPPQKQQLTRWLALHENSPAAL
ncbi:hypothetical protein HYS79_02015 [Patescibacteria group bacterium]|nr:hypothetical protein [Patescibacteria group bacterium]